MPTNQIRKQRREPRPNPGRDLLNDAQLCRLLSEISLTQRLIEQCTPEEIRDVNACLPDLLDNIRRVRAKQRVTIEVLKTEAGRIIQ